MSWHLLLTCAKLCNLKTTVSVMEETMQDQHGEAQVGEQAAAEQAASSAAPASASNPEAPAQWQQAMQQHWQALQQQGQQVRPKNAPFYSVGAGHPAYSLWAGQVSLPLRLPLPKRPVGAFSGSRLTRELPCSRLCTVHPFIACPSLIRQRPRALKWPPTRQRA